MFQQKNTKYFKTNLNKIQTKYKDLFSLLKFS